MISKQRVFSKEYTTYYSDYVKEKRGNEILKSVKVDNHRNNIINKFHSYEDFITLSRSFYKYSCYDNNPDYIKEVSYPCHIYAIRNLYNANISYNDKSNKNDYLGKEDFYNCKLLKPILYPSGIYKNDIEPNIHYPYKINLDHWCLKKRKCYQEMEQCDNCIDTIHDNSTTSIHGNSTTSIHDNSTTSIHNNKFTQNKCKTGLCKNTKPLFI